MVSWIAGIAFVRNHPVTANSLHGRRDCHHATLPGGTRVVLTASARVFERSVRIVRSVDEQRGREEIELAGADWRNTTPEMAAAPLTFDVPMYGVRSRASTAGTTRPHRATTWRCSRRDC